MEQAEGFVVTKWEALNILRIRRTSLVRLERAANIPGLPDRVGYTADELKRLMAGLRMIMRR